MIAGGLVVGLSLLTQAAAQVVSGPPEPLTLHIILAGDRHGNRVPSMDPKKWPKDVTVKVHMVADTHGSCTAEAVSYLQGIRDVYGEVRPQDIVAFMHGHDTSWHAPNPMQSKWLELLKLKYTYNEPIGAIYCFDNDRWAAGSLISEAKPVTQWWKLMFKNTLWEGAAPNLASMQVICRGCLSHA